MISEFYEKIKLPQSIYSMERKSIESTLIAMYTCGLGIYSAILLANARVRSIRQTGHREPQLTDGEKEERVRRP